MCLPWFPWVAKMIWLNPERGSIFRQWNRKLSKQMSLFQQNNTTMLTFVLSSVCFCFDWLKIVMGLVASNQSAFISVYHVTLL